jgi:hypothetical protein
MFCTIHFSIYSFVIHDLLNSDFLSGTDTIGDVRIPASFCGLLCFRPLYGVVSTLGTIANSQSLDAIGMFLPLSTFFIFGVYLLLTLVSIFHVFYENIVNFISEHVVACVPCFNGGQSP